MQPRVLAMLLIFTVACWGSLSSVAEALQRTREVDTRTRAYDWISENLPPGARILQEAYCPQLYFADKFKVTYLWSISQIGFEEVVDSFEYVVVSKTQWRRYSDWGHETYGPLFELPPVRSWTPIEGESYGPDISLYALGTGSGTPRRPAP
jgi:hypothetical protein